MTSRMTVSLMNLFYKINRRESTAVLTGLMAVIIALEAKFSVYGIISVIIAFLVHEASHRQTARRAGCSSRFVLDPLGLLITLISAILPIAFLAPGYVGINCWGLPISREGLLRIAGSGPLSNIVMAVVSLSLLVVSGNWSSIAGSVNIVLFLRYFTIVNLWIAIFNLLPVPPLDGSKIFKADKKIWAAMISVAAALYIILVW